ncbi:hypothetical protein TYRP_005455 [Tyrophagus putrescentiae]|nr:hypothetical protein TYRP_005455 [Tyrophagus putrescentiae]
MVKNFDNNDPKKSPKQRWPNCSLASTANAALDLLLEDMDQIVERARTLTDLKKELNIMRALLLVGPAWMHVQMLIGLVGCCSSSLPSSSSTSTSTSTSTSSSSFSSLKISSNFFLDDIRARRCIQAVQRLSPEQLLEALAAMKRKAVPKCEQVLRLVEAEIEQLYEHFETQAELVKKVRQQQQHQLLLFETDPVDLSALSLSDSDAGMKAEAAAAAAVDRGSLTLPITNRAAIERALSAKRLHLIQMWSDLVHRQNAIQRMVFRLEELEQVPFQMRRLLISQRQRLAQSTDFRIGAVILRQFQKVYLDRLIEVVTRTIVANRGPVRRLKREADRAVFARNVILAKAADLRAELVSLGAL